MHLTFCTMSGRSLKCGQCSQQSLTSCTHENFSRDYIQQLRHCVCPVCGTLSLFCCCINKNQDCSRTYETFICVICSADNVEQKKRIYLQRCYSHRLCLHWQYFYLTIQFSVFNNNALHILHLYQTVPWWFICRYS